MIRAYPPAPPRGQTQLLAEAAQLRAHPDFETVMLAYTRRWLDLRQVPLPVSKLIANEDRYRVLNFMYSVWAESAVVGDGSFTYGDLFTIARLGEVSPRIVKTTLAVAGAAGFLTRTPHPDDARRWLYMPSAAMLAFPLTWMLPIAEGLDALRPGPSRAERLAGDLSVLAHLYRSGGREHASGLNPVAMMPRLMQFCGGREGGAVVSYALIAARADNVPAPSRQALSDRFGLSKSQVAQVIAAGRELGYVAVENGSPVATEQMAEDHAQWVALSFAYLGYHMWPEDHV